MLLNREIEQQFLVDVGVPLALTALAVGSVGMYVPMDWPLVVVLFLIFIYGVYV